MNRTAIILATLTLCIAIPAADAQPQRRPDSGRGTDSGRDRQFQSPAQPTTRPLDYRERYSILTERNIFLRERRRPSRDNGLRERERPREREPEQTYALTGIVEEEGEFRAYFENLANPSFTRTSVGDSIARGKITGITLDAVEFEQNGQRRWIVIGHDLTGTNVRTTSAESTLTSTTTSPTTGPTTQTATLDFDPNDPNLTTLQKMKLRSMRERGLIK